VTTDEARLVERVERLAELAIRTWTAVAARERALGDDPDAAVSAAEPIGPRHRARELLDHTRHYLVPRARDLDAPLVVVVLGPTGSGKSTLVNTLAGAMVSEAGVLRPTTRQAVLVATTADADALLGPAGPLASLPRPRIRLVETGARPGVVLVDAPDIDSVEQDNRALADAILELADLCLFVTTATRYADQVPWDVLGRVAQRELPLIVIVNRLPTGDAADSVLTDMRGLIERAHVPFERMVGVAEGSIKASGQSLVTEDIAGLVGRIDELAQTASARRAVAEQALAGAVRGITPLVGSVATDLERAADDADGLRRIAAEDHAQELLLLLDRLTQGTVLREEVIRQWHTFVGADQVTRWFSRGIGRIRAAASTLVRGAPAIPAAAVQRGATEDLTALVVAGAADAARRTATHWSGDSQGARLIGQAPDLWTNAPDLPERTRAAFEDWIRTIATDVAATGATKRGVARGLSLSVNAGAVTVMLGVFAHTGGVTGAEVGIAAATAFLNQKLMNALFGEAAVQDLIDRARNGLTERLRGLVDAERARFDRLVDDGASLRSLAAELWSYGTPDG